MNTNSKSLERLDCISLTACLCVISGITIALPILALVFDFNYPSPDSRLNGILIRSQTSDSSVNVAETASTFRSRITVPAEPTTYDYEMVDEESKTGTQYSFDRFERMSISDQISELSPVVLTLPAARNAALNPSRREPNQSRFDETVVNTDELGDEYISADDFVKSLSTPEPQPGDLASLDTPN